MAIVDDFEKLAALLAGERDEVPTTCVRQNLGYLVFIVSNCRRFGRHAQ